MNRQHSESERSLNEISTRWSCIQDVDQFVLRYIDAMSKLLKLIVRDDDTAREVLQTFLLKVVERGFKDKLPLSGRFRDYLARSLRNASIDYYRKTKPVQATDLMLQQLEDNADASEDAWRESWTRCLLDRAWRQLEHHEFNTPNCLYYSVLKFESENKKSSSKQNAEKLGSTLERSITAEAYRQQLSRSRKKFAQLLITEVRETLECPSDEELNEEIAHLGLRGYVERSSQ